MRPFGREENEARKSDRVGSDFLEELLAQFFTQIKCGRSAAGKLGAEIGEADFLEELLAQFFSRIKCGHPAAGKEEV